jgi:hypothetical protein
MSDQNIHNDIDETVKTMDTIIRTAINQERKKNSDESIIIARSLYI